jgi:hypothetical protein
MRPVDDWRRRFDPARLSPAERAEYAAKEAFLRQYYGAS